MRLARALPPLPRWPRACAGDASAGARVAFVRFVRTPKGMLTGILILFVAVAGRVEGASLVAPGVAGAVGAAALLDLSIVAGRRRRLRFPSGAVVTGLLVAMVLSPYAAWYVPCAAAAIAILTKHLLRTRSANVFNPAAVGLVVVYYAFSVGHSWWGSMPAIVPSAAMPLLLFAAIVVARRVNKAPLVLAFLATHFGLFTGTALLGDPSLVADVFVPPDLNAALFFSGFMLTDPPTSPTRMAEQVAGGVVVAGASFLVFMLSGAAHYLLSGVLAGNVLEAVLRIRRGRRVLGCAPTP
ncbi:MAG: RnfABCDGE type electron transport complex subunit D [Vicinamibacterales bacterium]